MPVIVKPKPIDEVKAELEAVKAEKKAKAAERRKKEAEKKDWYGLVYCDKYGWCWIEDLEDGEGKPVCLGRTEEFIPYLRERGIDGENVVSVLIASQEFLSERKSQSCHSAMENDTTSIITPRPESNRATFRKDPRFLSLLDGLIAKGYGLPTIQKELKAKGYDVAYRTLGRWVNKRKARDNGGAR